MTSRLLSQLSTLPHPRCFKSVAPAGSRRGGRQLRTVSALPSPLANWRDHVSKAGKAALIAVVLSTGVSLAPPDVQLLQSAHADEEAGMSASGRRAAANERRKAILAKARANALSRGELSAGEDVASAESSSGDQDTGSSSGRTSIFDVPPEQPQLKTESAAPAPAKPQLPKIPAPELPKSKMPEIPKFSMPSKPPVQPPPSPSMSAPEEVPKTESPALPVPAPEASTPAPAPVQKTAAAPAPAQSSQGFSWFAKKANEPKTSPFSAVQPEKKQIETQTPDSKETKAGLEQQAKQQAAPVDKRKSKRHGPPLFLVQLLLTVGIVAGLAAAVIKYDAMMKNASKLEKAIISLAEKVQLPPSPAEKRPEA